MRSAYNPPRAKITIKPIFCLAGSFRSLRVGMGRIMMIRSVTMFIEALKNHENFLLIQRMSGVGDQKAETGRQAKMLVKIVYMPYTPTRASVAQQARRTPLLTKTRRYWRRIDALVKLREAL